MAIVIVSIFACGFHRERLHDSCFFTGSPSSHSLKSDTTRHAPTKPQDFPSQSSLSGLSWSSQYRAGKYDHSMAGKSDHSIT